MAIHRISIYDSDFYDYFEGHEILEGLSDSDYETVTKAIIAKAGESRDGRFTDFGWWFAGSDYLDDVWDVLQHAIDDYIEMVAPEVLKDMEGQDAHQVI